MCVNIVKKVTCEVKVTFANRFIYFSVIVTEVLIIDNDDTWRTEKMARNDCGTEGLKSPTVQSHGSQDINFPNILGEKVEKIVEHVVDKINKEVKPDVRKKVVNEGDTLPNPGGISQKMRVHDVEHIAQLQEFVSAPAQLHRMGSFTDSEIKMDIDQEQSEAEGYLEDQAKTKECIVFRNQIYSLSLLLSRRLKSGKDLQNLEDTLYSLDRTQGEC